MTALESSGDFHKPVCANPDDLVAYGETDEADIPSVVVYRLPAKLRR